MEQSNSMEAHATVAELNDERVRRGQVEQRAIVAERKVVALENEIEGLRVTNRTLASELEAANAMLKAAMANGADVVRRATEAEDAARAANAQLDRIKSVVGGP